MDELAQQLPTANTRVTSAFPKARLVLFLLRLLARGFCFLGTAMVLSRSSAPQFTQREQKRETYFLAKREPILQEKKKSLWRELGS